MKKKDILRIIDLNKKITSNKNLISLTRHKQFPSIEFDEEYWFPDIPDLKEEFETLKQEIKEAINENKKNIEELKQLTENCQHNIRLQANSFMISTSTCAFCKKTIYGDTTSNGNTIYNDINRNRNCVMFTEDRYDENYEDYIEGYSFDDVYSILLKILENKNAEEDIDLIKELKQLKLDKCFIDERPFEKEYYILIIGGSNTQRINDNSYMTSSKTLTATKLAKLLGGIPKVKVELLENPDTYKSNEFKNIFPYTNIVGYRFFNYTTIEELENELKKESHVPFDIIINTSNLQEFLITNNQISTKEYNLSLNLLFPNSNIINIPINQDIDEKEMLIKLKEQLFKEKPKTLKKELI